MPMEFLITGADYRCSRHMITCVIKRCQLPPKKRLERNATGLWFGRESEDAFIGRSNCTAIAKASGKLGWYLSVSRTSIIWRETPRSFARSLCVQWRVLRLAHDTKTLLPMHLLLKMRHPQLPSKLFVVELHLSSFNSAASSAAA
jgi:hypothetical protein